MEMIRDMVVLVFSVTGTFASVLLLIMGFKLYGRICDALERVGRASDDVHDIAEGIQSGARVAKEALTVASSTVPGSGWFRMTYRTAAAISQAAKLFSRFKRRTAQGPR